jgi:hypothetical protein
MVLIFQLQQLLMSILMEHLMGKKVKLDYSTQHQLLNIYGLIQVFHIKVKLKDLAKG